MAATIDTYFYRSDTADYSGTPSKIVFTSPNIDDESAAGTRSHVLPTLMDIALWYEDTDKMFRKTVNQTAPSTTLFELYGTLHADFDFSGGNTQMNLFDQTGSESDWPTADTVYYTNSDYFDYTGVVWNPTTLALTGGSDTGTETAASGTPNIFLDPDAEALGFQDCIVYEMTLGEAYNPYLTAWDDDTHTTTDNPVISGSHYRITGTACYITGTKDDPYPAGGSTYGTLISTAKDQILNGNTAKWTIPVPLRYNAVDSGVSGAFVIFQPRLQGMDVAGLTYGSYDFITTLHYQYT
jgi:hypothetical protein